MKNFLGIVIAVCLLYLCVMQTVQVVTIIKTAEFARQEIEKAN
ncbi:MAG: hypothetical protein O3A46_03660 [Candidatus Poribacteria bacterium]|nr:hypothetical protein [Candidatus Poribacteria bacterium]